MGEHKVKKYWHSGTRWVVVTDDPEKFVVGLSDPGMQAHFLTKKAAQHFIKTAKIVPPNPKYWWIAGELVYGDNRYELHVHWYETEAEAKVDLNSLQVRKMIFQVV